MSLTVMVIESTAVDQAIVRDRVSGRCQRHRRGEQEGKRENASANGSMAAPSPSCGCYGGCSSEAWG
jgi:hypothetical protein